jgi:hypothetical protein
MASRSGQWSGTTAPATEEGSPDGPAAHLADPRALTILTTEHWSLLSARSLVYNESFARTGMFLTFVTGTVVALGFVAQGSGFGSDFLMVAAALLFFDLAIGLATLGRISSAGIEEIRALQGMNRLRHAYLEMVPTLEPYFSTSRHDDLRSVLAVYGPSGASDSILGDFLHGLTTTPGMIGMITSAVGGGFCAAVAFLLGASAPLGILVALAAFALQMGLIWMVVLRVFRSLDDQIETRFPAPPAQVSPAARAAEVTLDRSTGD